MPWRSVTSSGDVADRPAVPQEVVERRLDLVAGQPEQDVDAGRLDVAVDHADPLALRAPSAAMFAVVFDLPVPPRNEWTLMIVARGRPSPRDGES